MGLLFILVYAVFTLRTHPRNGRGGRWWGRGVFYAIQTLNALLLQPFKVHTSEGSGGGIQSRDLLYHTLSALLSL